MTRRILITGCAGLIGSHLSDQLLQNGYSVRELYELGGQVHGEEKKRHSFLNNESEIIPGNIRDEVSIKRSLDGVDAVFHRPSSRKHRSMKQSGNLSGED